MEESSDEVGLAWRTARFQGWLRQTRRDIPRYASIICVASADQNKIGDIRNLENIFAAPT
jgi:hypothetical protein